jgi:MFS family permease
LEGFSLELVRSGPLARNRLFRRLWAALVLGTVTVYGLAFAAIVLVEGQAHSSAWTAAALVCSIAPAFIGSLAAGVVVDRAGRVPVLIAWHAVRAVLGVGFWAAAAFVPPPLNLVAILAINALTAFSTQFTMTAEMAMVPDLVDPAQLMPANALLQFGMLAGEGLGAVVLAPLLIKLAGVPAVGLLSVLLCLSALALVIGLPRGKPGAASTAIKPHDWATFRADVVAGWRTIARDRVLLVTAIEMTLAAAVLLVLLALLPGLATRHLGLATEDATMLMLVGGVGFVLGAILVSRWDRVQNRLNWMGMGLVGLGMSVALLGALSGSADPLPLVLPAIWVVGLALSLVIIPARTVLQERPPAAMRGRVIAFQLFLGNAAAVIPLLLGGALADQWGIRPVLGLLGLLTAAAGLAGLRQGRSWAHGTEHGSEYQPPSA